MVNAKCEKKQPGTGPGCSISIYPEQLVSATKQVIDAKTHAIDIVLERKTRIGGVRPNNIGAFRIVRVEGFHPAAPVAIEFVFHAYAPHKASLPVVLSGDFLVAGLLASPNS